MSFPPRFRRKIDRPLSHRLPKIIGMPAWLLMAAAPLPRKIQDTEGVDGKPFIILGGQIHNPNAFPDLLEPAWPRLKALNANTVEYPVYWNEIEPQEGRFEFGDFDLILRKARSEGL